ncbi:class I SAM-dependent methyltransferase [Kamptonema formosum]|uniref:class I SAM-dependent methyltransferase n=1 Tax=Kamptonema formosum TaxID=331992 RepID=UPI000347B610|nr:class I SAM-dependent methyltransferase [Oscillatoria sp. PCC 10802]
MAKTNVQLPYFDKLFEQFRKGNPDALLAFGRHAHWGYWDYPAVADGTVADFASAAERLCRRVCDAGGAGDGQRILDCGCGFGGTIASLNERFSSVGLVGVNIDPRQIARAREQVKPRTGNQIEFVEADACQLPFEDGSFDLVLAVECIFHFPSRERFFQEARRVLRKGGRLALCDFVPVRAFLPLMKFGSQFATASVIRTYGDVIGYCTLADYRNLGKGAGFLPLWEEDITGNTLPTYPLIRRLYREAGEIEMDKVTAGQEWLSRFGLSRYMILSFQVP